MRVVLDTSVLFAAFRLETGFWTELFRQCVLRYDLVTSIHILDELQRHLVDKAQIPQAKVQEIINSLRSFGLVVQPLPLPTDVCRDPEDVPVLGTAISSKANILVTGDKDLLVLNPFQGVSILTPRQFHTDYVVAPF